MRYGQSTSKRSATGLFGLPRLLQRSGLASSAQQATQLAKSILVGMIVVANLLAVWLIFGSDSKVDRSEPYYEYTDDSELE